MFYSRLLFLDPAKQVSVTKKWPFHRETAIFDLCAHLGSNQGPKDYESSTLTN